MTAAEFNSRSQASRFDLTGQTFGRLQVIERVGSTKHGHAVWRCLCSCGATTTVTTRNLRGTTVSCGCARREQAGEMNLIHGQSGTALYRRWQAMVNRVTNPNDDKFRLYGGRGITITERWMEPDGRGFMNFRADMGSTFREDLTLDRIDVNGPYSPANCRWANATQQARNTRRNRHLTLWGATKSLAEWCELLDLNYDRTKRRIQRGWSAERALAKDAGLATTWNRLWPVGTPVDAYPITRAYPPLVTWTRSAAWETEDRPVVLVEGHADRIALTHIDPNPTAEEAS